MNDTVRQMLKDYIEAVENFYPIKAKAILKQIKQWMEKDKSEHPPISA